MRALPSGTNWLKGYLTYTSDLLSPESFNLWTGISVIGSVLQRKVFIPVNEFICYPNNYIVLMGPPGTMKSTAIRAGRRFISEIPNIHLNTDSTTREKLIINFTNSFRDGHSSMTAHSSELATLFASSKLDMVNFLTDIYDSPPMWEHDTKLGGRNTIRAPCLNLLAATTPDSFSKEIPVETSGIGLTSRMIIQFESKPRIQRWRTPHSEIKSKLRGLLIEDLLRISTLKGEYELDSATDEFYDQWFRSQIEVPNTSGDKALAPYFARKHTHVLKLSMIVAASERDDLVLCVDDIQEAMRILADTEQHMSQVFAGYGANPLAFSLQQIFLMILDSGMEGMGYQPLLRIFQRDVSQEDLDRVLSTLEKTGQITRKPGASDLVYVATAVLQAEPE